MFLSDLVIIGLGSQAKAWALNLKDSNRKFIVALNPESKSYDKAHQLGFKTISLDNPQLKNYEHFLMLIPDDQQLAFFEKNISFISKGAHFIYAHGYALTRHKLIDTFPQFDHSLLAPKAIASEVRYQYETKGKIGAVLYSEMENRNSFLYDLARDLGFTALYENHFEDETMADLFSEQSLLCSVIPYAALKSYNLLVQNGISKELAFMECYLELRSISKAFVELGPLEFFKLISPNALIGSEKGKNLIINHQFEESLNKIFIDIKNKHFYKEVEENHSHLREEILKRWKHEDLTKTFQELKNELI